MSQDSSLDIDDSVAGHMEDIQHKEKPNPQTQVSVRTNK